MKKLFELISQKNLSALILFISAAAFIGCASTKNAVTKNDSPAAKTPEIESKSSRIEPLENFETEKPETLETEASTASKVVTRANFDQIRLGMSYAEAVKILGDEGMRISTMKVNNRETTIFKWTVPDFSKYIDLHFENDKVIEKKQKGLM